MKPVAEKQGARVMVNMTKAEKSQLEREAQEVGLSLSAYLLQLWKEKGD